MSKSVKVLAHFLLASRPHLAQKFSIVTRAVVRTSLQYYGGQLSGTLSSRAEFWQRNRGKIGICWHLLIG